MKKALPKIAIMIGITVIICWWFLSIGMYEVETVCNVYDNKFDCDIIYSRLGKYHNENFSYVYSSIANIEKTACSNEVLTILEEQFNLTLKDKECHYYCCITDGTCMGEWWEQKKGINIQAYGFK